MGSHAMVIPAQRKGRQPTAALLRVRPAWAVARRWKSCVKEVMPPLPKQKAHEWANSRRELAHRRFGSSATSPAQRPLERHGTCWVRRVLRPCSACLANRLVRTRMLGGVGGARSTLTPTRFLVSTAAAQFGHSVQQLPELDGALRRSRGDACVPCQREDPGVTAKQMRHLGCAAVPRAHEEQGTYGPCRTGYCRTVPAWGPGSDPNVVA